MFGGFEWAYVHHWRKFITRLHGSDFGSLGMFPFPNRHSPVLSLCSGVQHLHTDDRTSLDLLLRQKRKWLQKVKFKIVIPSLKFDLSFDGETIRHEPSAIHAHFRTSLGVFDDSPFALGGCSSQMVSSCNKEVEHFGSSWSSLGQFPFVSSWIYWYSTVTVKNVVYIFGK